jgi:hypothetical protein
MAVRDAAGEADVEEDTNLNRHVSLDKNARCRTRKGSPLGVWGDLETFSLARLIRPVRVSDYTGLVAGAVDSEGPCHANAHRTADGGAQ